MSLKDNICVHEVDNGMKLIFSYITDITEDSTLWTSRALKQ